MADIQHFVVLMLENRSFDHIFGYRPGVNGLKGTEINLINPDEPAGPTNAAFKVSNAEPYNIIVGEGPSHSFNAVNTQIYGDKAGPASGRPAANQGFVKSYRDSLYTDHVTNPTQEQIAVVMQAFAPGTLPALWSLADAFCVCDNWFCDVPGPTMPNRMFMHMATSAGYVHNVWHNVFDNDTIYSRLQQAGKTWATYDFDQNEIRQFSQLRGQTTSFRSFESDFASDIAGDKLANYSFVVPRFMSGSGKPVNSMHGPYDARPADQLVADVYNTLRSNVEVWNKSVLIVTMDEHGGFYDHVVPPATVSPDGIDSPPPGDTATWAPSFQFDRLGLRVPTIIASPWLDAQVDSAEYRHTSVLATVKKYFGLSDFLTKRDATANSFEGLFSRTQPRTDTPESIQSVDSISTPRTFASGSTTDHAEFGLDSLQREMVHGVDLLTQSNKSKLLSVGSIPDTQGDASDFVKSRLATL